MRRVIAAAIALLAAAWSVPAFSQPPCTTAPDERAEAVPSEAGSPSAMATTMDRVRQHGRERLVVAHRILNNLRRRLIRP